MALDREDEADADSLSAAPDGGTYAALLGDLMALSQAPSSAHIAVIGHHTLPYVLALLQGGCASVRSLRPGSPAPDCEPVEWVWIVDLHDRQELVEALQAARLRVSKRGRVVVEPSACQWPNALMLICDAARAAGLDVITMRGQACRVVLAPAIALVF